jgi:thiol:disulfide interchange protein DsbC
MRNVVRSLLVSFLVVFLFAVSACAQSQVDQLDTKAVQEQLNKIFPNFKVSEVNATDIPGIYEVIGESGQILYYSPKGYLLFGEIWTVAGKSITGERMQAIQSKKVQEILSSIPFDKAVKLGNGSKTVIEISDPTCPYCRMASKKIDEYKDVTRYVFFMPIHGEDSIKQISYIICSKDPEKAYHEAYSGKIDNQVKTMNITNECKAKMDKILSDHQILAQKLNVRGTPFFIIGKTPVPGANIPLIESLLKGENQ